MSSLLIAAVFLAVSLTATGQERRSGTRRVTQRNVIVRFFAFIGKPIKKEAFIEAVKLRGLTAAELIERIETRGVSFRVNDMTKAELRELGMPQSVVEIAARSYRASENEVARISVIADTLASDYTAYSSGNRFYIVIPNSAASRYNQEKGSAAEVFDLQIQQRGADTVISARKSLGVHARVEQSFNRIEAVFVRKSAH